MCNQIMIRNAVGLQGTQESQCHTVVYLSALAPSCLSHQFQYISVCLQDSNGLCTLLPPLSLITLACLCSQRATSL